MELPVASVTRVSGRPPAGASQTVSHPSSGAPSQSSSRRHRSRSPWMDRGFGVVAVARALREAVGVRIVAAPDPGEVDLVVPIP